MRSVSKNSHWYHEDRGPAFPSLTWRETNSRSGGSARPRGFVQGSGLLRSIPSSYPATRIFPSPVNARPLTGDAWSLNCRITSPSGNPHSRIEPSSHPAARIPRSGPHASADNPDGWWPRHASSLPSGRDQVRTVPSLLPVKSNELSGEIAMHEMTCRCPSQTERHYPSAPQTLAVRSLDPLQRNAPSWEKARQDTRLRCPESSACRSPPGNDHSRTR